MGLFYRKGQAAASGGVMGLMIGATSSFIHGGFKVTKSTAPAALFMAVVIGVGSALKA